MNVSEADLRNIVNMATELQNERNQNTTLRAERDNLAAANAELREALDLLNNASVTPMNKSRYNFLETVREKARAVLAKYQP